MEYTINQLAKLAGVSARTLRYYDEIALLKPVRVSSTGYRIYGAKERDLLQQILYYKVLAVPLEEIKTILSAPDYNASVALAAHRDALITKRNQLDILIYSLDKTLLEMEGSYTMTDQEKFEGFKDRLIDENDRQYGEEVTKKYGAHAYEQSKAAFKNMDEKTYTRMTQLGEAILEALQDVLASPDTFEPGASSGQHIANMHREWLTMAWGSYNEQAHLGLVDMYLADSRFKAYYDKAGDGATQVLRDAVYALIAAK